MWNHAYFNNNIFRHYNFNTLGNSLCLLIYFYNYTSFIHYRDGILVPIINCLTSFYTGFVIFSVLGYMAHMKGVEVKDVATDGRW